MEQAERFRKNGRQTLGCVIVSAIVFVPLFVIGIASMSGEEPKAKAPDQQAPMAPMISLDAKLMPFLQANLRFDYEHAGPEMITDTGRAIGELGRRMSADDTLRAAKSLLVMVSDRDGNVLHLTLEVPKLLAAVERERQPGAYLLLAREVGFNEIRGERAAREWCAGAHTSFCDQVP